MLELKPGTKVLVNEHIRDWSFANPTMRTMTGAKLTIFKAFTSTHNPKVTYLVEENEWGWADHTFDVIVKPQHKEESEFNIFEA